MQFLDTSTQHLIEPTTEFGGIRLAQMPDLLATKLKAIQDRGELRDYFDIMMIEQRTELTVEEGLTLLVQRYKPRAPVGVIANIVLGLGFLGDVGDDPALPVPREEIERYWVRRHQEIARSLRL